METEAEYPKPSGSSDNLLTSPSPDGLSANSQSSLGGKHTPQYENVHSSPQHTLKHPSSDTGNEFLPKRILTDPCSHKYDMQEEHTLQNLRPQTQLENLNQERMDLEEPLLRNVGGFSQTAPSNNASVFDAVGEDTSAQESSTDGPQHIEVQPHRVIGEEIHGSEAVNEPTEIDLRIDEDDPSSTKETEVGKKLSNDPLIGNAETCDPGIMSVAEKHGEDLGYATSTKSHANRHGETVLVSEKEFKENSFSPNSCTPQVDGPVEFTNGDMGEKSEALLAAEKKQEEARLFTEIETSREQQGATWACDRLDSHQSPVATLFELHRELVSRRDTPLKLSAKLEDNNQPVTTNQEESVQLMQVSKECSEIDALSEVCINAVPAAQTENKPMLTADSETSSVRDNLEYSNQFTTELPICGSHDESEEILIAKTNDVDGGCIFVSKNLTNEMDVSPTDELMETRELSLQSLAHASDTAVGKSSPISQSTEMHLRSHNEGCGPEIAADSMMCEGTVEASAIQPDGRSLDSPVERHPSDLPNLSFPAANIERIRTSGFTRQEAVEALDRCHGNTDLALLVLLAKGIVVPT